MGVPTRLAYGLETKNDYEIKRLNWLNYFKDQKLNRKISNVNWIDLLELIRSGIVSV